MIGGGAGGSVCSGSGGSGGNGAFLAESIRRDPEFLDGLRFLKRCLLYRLRPGHQKAGFPTVIEKQSDIASEAEAFRSFGHQDTQKG